MSTIIVVVILFLLLDLAALRGWAPDTRDSKDWNVPNDVPGGQNAATGQPHTHS